ncbi:MAG: hypothetical protein R3E88_14865 [Myxococcota bacterium]
MSKILDLLARLFPPDAAEPDWDSLVAAVSRELGGAHCIAWVEPGLGAPTAASTEAVRERLAAYDGSPSDHEVDYWRVSRFPIGEVWSTDVAEARGLPRLRQTVLDPLDMREGLVVGVPLASDRASIVGQLCVFPNGDAKPGHEAVALLEELAPWLVHAARATARQRALTATSSALSRSIDRLRIGVVLLDDDGHVVLANRSAVAILEGADGSSFVAATALGARRERMQQAVARLLDSHGSVTGHVRPHVSVSRLAPPDELATFMGATTAVFIPDPATVEVELVEPLRKHYGLTPAEARLAALLASDFTLDEAAEHLGLTVGTVRTRLKRLFEKTGTNRQASLVRRIVTGPGLFRDGE